MKRILFIGSFRSESIGTKSISEKIKHLLIKKFELIYSSNKKNKVIRFFAIFNNLIFRRYDIVHCDVYSGQSFWIANLALWISKLKNKGIILNLRGGALIESISDSNFKKLVILLWQSKNLIIVSPSKFIIKDMMSKCNIKVRYLPNYINLKDFKYNPKRLRLNKILWVRAFNKFYQPDLAIRAFKKVLKIYPDSTLTMVGPDNGELNNIKKLAIDLKIIERINFIGSVENNIISQYYESHNVFINTTMYESFGMSLMESAACGTPIVTTKVGEIDNIWNKDEVLFVKNDPNEISEKICSIFKNHDSARDLVLNARKKSESFGWDAVELIWHNLIDECSNWRNK